MRRVSGDPKGGKKASDIASTSEGSLLAGRLKSLVEKSPIAQSLGKEKVRLPPVTAPPLEGLEVSVPPPPTLVTQDVLDRLEVLVRLIATTRVRTPTEPVAWGDQICVDLLGHAGGHLVPFSPREEEWFYVEPHPQLPGLFEGLIGKKIGDCVQVDVVLPVTYPIEQVRGTRVTFSVDIRSDVELSLPDIKNGGFIPQLGKGATIDEVMKSIVSDLEKERANETLLKAQNLVLDEVARRASLEVPEALIDDEIRRKWQGAESPFLVRKGFKPEQLKEALEGWLGDPATRSDAERRLRISLVMRAIAERDQVKLEPAEVKKLIARAGRIFGVEIDNPGEALAEDTEAAEQVMAVALHVATVEHVMKRAKVTFQGAQKRAPA
jgi:trigger factor